MYRMKPWNVISEPNHFCISCRVTFVEMDKILDSRVLLPVSFILFVILFKIVVYYAVTKFVSYDLAKRAVVHISGPIFFEEGSLHHCSWNY